MIKVPVIILSNKPLPELLHNVFSLQLIQGHMAAKWPVAPLLKLPNSFDPMEYFSNPFFID